MSVILNVICDPLFPLSAPCAAKVSRSPPVWTNTCACTQESGLTNVFTVTRWVMLNS